MKKRKRLFFSACILSIFTILSGCKHNDPPTLTTSAVSEISLHSAVSGGNVTDDGGSGIIARGVCWSTVQDPTTENSKTSDGTGTGEFTSQITGLTESTTYYLRAYAINGEGTSYGNSVSFTTTTPGLATLITQKISALTPSTCTTGGNISSDGGSGVTARGICWSTSPDPTISDSKTSDGTGAGVFASNLTNLSPGTVYYLRAYATNSVGTAYGQQIKISTSISDVEGNIYKTTQIGNQLWTAENLRTTLLNDNTPIPNVADSITWLTISTPAYVWYRNNPANKDIYGALYSWFTVQTGKLCPAGWHVPSNAEYEAMEISVGMPADSVQFWGWRGKDVALKLKDSIGWITGNGNNSSGFSAKPSGYRAWANSQFRGLHEIAYFWTSTDDAINQKPTVAWYRRIDAGANYIYKATTGKGSGKGIRCIKD
jgi:uncharacterized protein (TIGR02145 family)